MLSKSILIILTSVKNEGVSVSNHTIQRHQVTGNKYVSLNY